MTFSLISPYMVDQAWKGGRTKQGLCINIFEDGCNTQLVIIERKNILSLIDLLDKKAESSPLSDYEINSKQYLKERLVTLLREEEIKRYERAKVKTLLEGDNNSKFFHLVANGKHRKQCIFKLEQEDGIVVGDEQLKSIHH